MSALSKGTLDWLCAAVYGFIFLPVVVLGLFSLQATSFPDSALHRSFAALVRGRVSDRG